MIRRLLFCLVLVFALPIPAPAGEAPVVVLASLDVTVALGRVLAAGTGIEVVDAVPQEYFMNGHDAYFKAHREAFFPLARKADAVLTVGGAWPVDPLYRWARRGNIRVVEIDATRPLGGYGAGVPLVTVQGHPVPYVWRAPGNLSRMASIATEDLCRLVPEDAETVRSNLKRLQNALFHLRSRYEDELLRAASVTLAALTDGYASLTGEFGMDVRFYDPAPESSRTEADLERLAARLREQGVAAVVCAWEPGPDLSRAIRQGGAAAVVFKPFRIAAGADPFQSLADWYGGNLSRLAAALNR